MDYSTLIILHLIGASIWVGGHLVLATSYLPEALKTKSVTELQNFENKFEKIGIPALIIQIITGFMLAQRFNPDHSTWFSLDTPTRGIAIKLILLIATGILALDARLRIIPKLNSENISSLAWHIIPVTLIGVLFLVVGAFFRVGGI